MSKQTPGVMRGSEAGDRLTPGRLAELACLLEVNATKPGNVHRFADLPGLRYDDFVLSAAAIAGPLDQQRTQGVGATVYSAIAATRRVVSTNTNLGIVLLLAPLAGVPDGVDLAAGVEAVLAATTVADASLVYRAIRLAQPGGMGEVPSRTWAASPRSRSAQSCPWRPSAIWSRVSTRTAFIKCCVKACPHCVDRCATAKISKRRSSRLTCTFWRITPTR